LGGADRGTGFLSLDSFFNEVRPNRAEGIVGRGSGGWEKGPRKKLS